MAREYLQGRTLPSASELPEETLIGMDVPTKKIADWHTWLRLAGVKREFSLIRLVVSNFDLALRAALAGQGVALMWSCVAPVEMFKTGALVRPTPEVIETKIGEYVLYEPAVLDSPPHRLFFDWLLNYANETRTSVACLFVK